MKKKSEIMQEPHRFLAAARKQWGPPLPPSGDPYHYQKLAKIKKGEEDTHLKIGVIQETQINKNKRK